MSGPDVTVVVAVYNTMPDLTTCLESLVNQTIGHDRLQIVAVDDGSTDGSGAELDRFAAAYPSVLTVVHQPNSGGPAAPSNRALDLATGRYVFFIGADDYLGREALERLVSAADRWGSDVVLGRMVGVNKRYVHQEIYDRTRSDIDLFDSPLPFSLSNTKLFRRDLVERHHLRFPEDMAVGSDQPFTLEACLRAARISVLADYDYYFAVKRLNSTNITYRSDHLARLECVERIVRFVADMVEPGQRRDAVLRRHFAWEIAKLFRPDYLKLDAETREQVRARVGKLVREYLTDGIRARLDAATRVLVGTAAYGRPEDLLAIIRLTATDGLPSTVVRDQRWFAAFPGFGEAGGLSDEWYELEPAASRWLAALTAVSVRSVTGPDGDRRVQIFARSPRPDLADLVGGDMSVRVGEADAVVRLLPADPMGTTVEATFRLQDLAADLGPAGTTRAVRVRVADSAAVPVRGFRPPLIHRVVYRDGTRLHLVTINNNHKGHLAFTVWPVTLRRVAARLRRRLPRGGSSS
ncbi:glycosyltransferase family 2 protein [Micromonospora chalcea]|uniref:glycosyltransferase family 2 protein n=1 Tax=Micromonospora sp. B006 TaxID=2201999 RepID=UPI000E307001|nr:glycosyltransferase [Micromonospora sp. B006]AXO37415.1 dolichol-phosphate mannosyltransferase [Micromonospora sp. B006]